MKEKGIRGNVPARAQELAQEFSELLGTPPGFDRVEVIKGYLNLFFNQGVFIKQVVDTVLSDGPSLGRASPPAKR